MLRLPDAAGLRKAGWDEDHIDLAISIAKKLLEQIESEYLMNLFDM